MSPDWLTVTPANIVTDSRLAEFMLQANYSANDAQADAERLLNERVPDVRRRLRMAAAPYAWPYSDEQLLAAFPNESSDQRAERDADQKASANLIIKEMVIAALLKPLGDEKSIKAAQQMADGRGEAVIGNARVGSTEDMLKSLEAEIKAMALDIANKAGKKRKRRAFLMGAGDIEGARS